MLVFKKEEKMTTKKQYSDLSLNKPSALISMSASKALNVMQYKYYDALIYNAKRQMIAGKKNYKFKIKISELKSLVGDKNNTQNKRTKEYIKALEKLSCEYNILGKDGKLQRYGSFWLLAGVDVESVRGTVVYSFPHQIEDVLWNNVFAKIDMELIRDFKSKYAIKLYELCSDYENAPAFPEISISQFKKIFNCNYDRIERIKTCVINPAVMELNNSSRLNFFITYALLESNSEFKSIRFMVNRRLPVPEGTRLKRSEPFPEEPEFGITIESKENKKCELDSRTVKDGDLKDNQMPLFNLSDGIAENKSANAVSLNIDEIIKYLNQKLNAKFKRISKTESLIKARLNEGFTVDDFKIVIDKKYDEWKDDHEMVRYLRPETLFSNKFDSYLNQKIVVNNKQKGKCVTVHPDDPASWDNFI